MAINSFVFRFDDIEVREREFSVVKAGQVLTVEPKAFRVLLFLLRNPQRLISKEELLNSVWGDAAVTEGSLTRCIWLLRSVLGDDIRSPRYIETVATVGYRFIGKVEVSEDPSEDPPATKEPNDLRDVREKAGSWNRVWGWGMAASGLLALCLGATIWYLHRPLPPLRVTGYTQITHDGRRKILAGTDGRRLYITQTLTHSLGTAGEIAQVAISGGKIAPVPVTVPNPLLLDVSTDGSNLLVRPVEGRRTAGDVWSVPTLGGFARRMVEAEDACFSTDGNSLAYSTSQGEIWLARSDGSEAHKFASAGGYAAYMALSPDGRVIRFTRDDMLWQISSGESAPHKLFSSFPASSVQCCGRWTPDGKFFLFVSQSPMDQAGEIWALDERRGLLHSPRPEPVKLAGAPFQWDRPIPGKDGKSIFAEGQVPRGELSRFDAQTKQFVPFLGGISAQGVVFSKDGKSIAYVSYPEGILWKANRDGSNPRQLSEASMWVFLPRWSPDGTRIAFAGFDRKAGGMKIYVVSPEGDGPPKPLVEDNEAQSSPSWSPDGHRIAFDDSSIDNNGVFHQDIRMIDLDSRQITRIPGSDGMGGVRWSPDVRYLSAGPNQFHLKIFDFKTQHWSELTLKGLVDSPEWSGDGRYIYFRRVMGDQGVFRMSLTGGDAEQKMADLKDWHDAGWFGAYMGLDPTDAPLLLRDVGSDDIYALTLEQK